MTFVMRIIGLVHGQPSPFDGRYVKEYDPGRNGVDPDGLPMLAHVVVTDDPDQAIPFPDVAAAHRLWKRIDPREPLRSEDGKPNRPLTAFTVEIEPL